MADRPTKEQIDRLRDDCRIVIARGVVHDYSCPREALILAILDDYERLREENCERRIRLAENRLSVVTQERDDLARQLAQINTEYHNFRKSAGEYGESLRTNFSESKAKEAALQTGLDQARKWAEQLEKELVKARAEAENFRVSWFNAVSVKDGAKERNNWLEDERKRANETISRLRVQLDEAEQAAALRNEQVRALFAKNTALEAKNEELAQRLQFAKEGEAYWRGLVGPQPAKGVGNE